MGHCRAGLSHAALRGWSVGSYRGSGSPACLESVWLGNRMFREQYAVGISKFSQTELRSSIDSGRMLTLNICCREVAGGSRLAWNGRGRLAFRAENYF